MPLARINAISQSQLDQYTAQYKAAEATVRSAEQTLSSARMNVGYTELRSPIDGIISNTSAHVGDYVGPGTQFGVLTTISNIDTLTVDVAIPMAQYLRSAGPRTSIFDNAGLLTDIRLMLADGTESVSYTHLVRASAIVMAAGILGVLLWGAPGFGTLAFTWLGVYVFLAMSGGGLYAFDTALFPAKRKN